ncbi:MAG: hypothetical protein ACOZCL_18485, partial [Bacillota bacterium]
MEESKVLVEPNDMSRFISEHIAVNRFETKRINLLNKYNNGQNYNPSLIDANTNILPIKCFIDEFELTDANVCMDYFLSATLNESCNGVRLCEWIRAFAVLRREADDYIEKAKFPQSLSIENWCMIGNIEYWKEKLTHYGVAEDSAIKIINTLIYDEKSLDLFDSPFILLGDKLLILPSIVKSVQGSRAMLSLFARKGFNLSFAGYNFEDIILSEFHRANIEAKRVHRKVLNAEGKEEEYECDIAFSIGKDLYLCELKYDVQPINSMDFFEFEQKKKTTINEQFKRISNFYLSNLHYVKEELNLSKNWTPRKIYKLLIVVFCKHKMHNVASYFCIGHLPSILLYFFLKASANLLLSPGND